MRILSVVGARPNFMKLAPVDRELAKRPGVEHLIVHTGQHYDPEMSAAFFEELWIPAPDHHLGVGSGSHAAQTAAVMQRSEEHTSELQSLAYLVCRLLLEKKKTPTAMPLNWAITCRGQKQHGGLLGSRRTA